MELEDVKISQTFESDLEMQPKQSHSEEKTSFEISAKKNDDDVARYLKWVKTSSTQALDYILKFLPPTTMVVLQVTFSI